MNSRSLPFLVSAAALGAFACVPAIALGPGGCNVATDPKEPPLPSQDNVDWLQAVLACGEDDDALEKRAIPLLLGKCREIYERLPDKSLFRRALVTEDFGRMFGTELIDRLADAVEREAGSQLSPALRIAPAHWSRRKSRRQKLARAAKRKGGKQ